jgi:hypothetical protein
MDETLTKAQASERIEVLQRKTGRGTAPCLFGLFSVVVLLHARLSGCWTRTAHVAWAGKDHMTFSAAITAVRRWLWIEWVFATCGQRDTFSKLPRPFQDILLHALAPAA